MFRSTYGMIKERRHSGPGRPWRGLIHKAVDFERGVEFFKIGSGNGEVDVHGPVYCLKIGDTHIPIAQVAREERIGEIAATDFVLESRRPGLILPTYAQIPETVVTLGHFGTHLPSIPHARGSVDYMKLWEGPLDGHEFPSGQAMQQAFALVQEALPVLRFDHYPFWADAAPTVCRHVRLRGVSDGIDASGAREAASVVLQAPANFNPSVDRIAANHIFDAPTLEELMAEVLDLERCHLFFGGVYYTAALKEDDRFWAILERSYKAHYRDAFTSFQHFLMRVVEIIQSRESARTAFWSYDVKYRYPAPPAMPRR